VKTETILKEHNILILPTFLYGSENWTLTASHRRRTEVTEMKLLRPLASYTLYDHKANDTIWRELQITCTLDKIDEYRLNWFLHLQRMPQNRSPLKSYRYRPQGRRTIGRPKKLWREQLQLWRRNGSKGPILDAYDDDDDYSVITGRPTHPVQTLPPLLNIKQWPQNIFIPNSGAASIGQKYWLHKNNWHCWTLEKCV
jgi:hypothetical protein